jgi:hypothetical protein
MRTVYPVGTTLYRPDRCCNGYTLLWRGHVVRLIDMNGRTAHAWQVSTGEIDDRLDRARLLANGNVLVQRGGMMSTTGAIEEYDWQGDLAWQYFPQGGFPHRDLLGPHHDVFRKPDGDTLLICRHAVARHHLSRIAEPRYRVDPFYEDVILEVDRDGEVVWRWHGAEHLNLNQYRTLASPGWHAGPHNSTACDWMHTNTVQALPENRWADAGDPRFRPGNILISPRSLDAVHIIDRQTKQIVWTYTGDYMGGLSGQHEPHMIEQGLPGAGNILIFDNGASPWKDLGHAGRSYVLEVNPFTQQIVWRYEDGEQFHSSYTSSAQRLANGNTLICESAGRRVFEVTVDGEIVWEHVADTPRAYRYAYDHCPQTAALGRPRGVPVTPPAELRIPPDEPLED